MKRGLALAALLLGLAGCAPRGEAPEVTAPIPAPTPAPVATSTPAPTPRPMPEAPAYLPQGLVDFLSGCVTDGAEVERIKPLGVGRVLSDEEISALVEGDADLWAEIGRFLGPESGAGPYPGYILLEADGDNDGLLDILAITSEGSGGFTNLQFFQGQPEGGYRESYQIFNLIPRSEYDVISYDGANYFLATSFDYNTKIYDGLEVYCFQEGILVEEVFVHRSIAGFEVAEQEGDAALAEELARAATEFDDSKAGSAEQRREQGYVGDLDNDGVAETYRKAVWYPSTFFAVRELYFEYEELPDGPVYGLLSMLREADWLPQLLWADQEERGTVVYTVSTDWENRVRADSWFLSGGGRELLASVTLEPDYEVVPMVYTQDVNVDFLDPKAFF